MVLCYERVMVIMLRVCYDYYVRSVLWLLCEERVIVIMLEVCYGYYVRNGTWLLCQSVLWLLC